ncbi:SGNH/GDSL hydrolase family protein [Ginsengibacter hankyongi]|uniref:SGNH/GDSL hydrolase family protein n=1 Tax=Ginsengibacter hankyongi TaxID=2607284 RepID=A0A5J5ILF2_9BACT|nr:SGNH/GDSL hydrolase family protein [Ginsengibacter hankyongi]KAA9041906.1 SGNH/GDSL hydrolase family protein [Ginsengibacter hankyongi]
MRLRYIVLSTFVLASLFAFKGTQPEILIIGDSISIGYTPFVKSTLENKAQVFHCKGNAQYSSYGLSKLNDWLGNEHWDIIQFNWGLWDICYRDPNKPIDYTNRDKINGKINTTKEDYKANLETIINRLKQTKAKLIFVTTTCVPDNEPGRYDNDVQDYNIIAIQVMKENNIPVNDLYSISKQIHKEDGLGDNNVHYKAEGYQKLAIKVCEGLNKLIND